MLRGSENALQRAAAHEAGQATVEFALVIPLLLFLILGAIDVGKAINYWVNETNLAGAAARWAVVGKSPVPGQMIPAALKAQPGPNELQNGGGSVEGSGVHIRFCLPTGDGSVGQPVRAVVEAKYDFLSVLGGVIPDKVLTATATMRLEKKYVPGVSPYAAELSCPPKAPPPPW